MKVLIVTGPVFPEQLAIWQECRRAGIDLRILGSSVRGPNTALSSKPRAPEGIPTVLARPVTPLPRRGRLWWAYRELPGVARRMEPEIIHVLDEPWSILTLQSMMVARARRRVLPVCTHGADNVFTHGGPIEQKIRGEILQAVLPRLGGLAGWTDDVIELSRRFGLPASTPTVVVPDVVADPRRFTPVSDSVRRQARSSLGLPKEKRIVGFVGRLAPEKGVLDAIAAIRGLDSGESVVLCIWGIGPLEGKVRALESQYPDRILYLGPLDLDEVPTAIQSSDILLIPSKASPFGREQFGRVALEAMLCACPVIAYRSGALPSTLQDGAVFVDEGDVHGLSSALKRLLTNGAERVQIGSRARESALRRYQPDVLSKRLIEFWNVVRGRR